MWDTFSNPTLQGSPTKARRIIRGQHLPHNTFVFVPQLMECKVYRLKLEQNPVEILFFQV